MYIPGMAFQFCSQGETSHGCGRGAGCAGSDRSGGCAGCTWWIDVLDGDASVIGRTGIVCIFVILWLWILKEFDEIYSIMNNEHST